MIINASELLRETLRQHLNNWQAEREKLKQLWDEADNSVTCEEIDYEIEALEQLIYKTKIFLSTI